MNCYKFALFFGELGWNLDSWRADHPSSGEGHILCLDFPASESESGPATRQHLAIRRSCCGAHRPGPVIPLKEHGCCYWVHRTAQKLGPSGPVAPHPAKRSWSCCSSQLQLRASTACTGSWNVSIVRTTGGSSPQTPHWPCSVPSTVLQWKWDRCVRGLGSGAVVSSALTD